VPVTELVDVDFGEWTGLSRDEVREEYKADFQEWLENPLSVTFLGGESVAEAGRRCFDWLSRLAASDSRRVAVVTHRVILKLLLLHMLKAPGSAFWQVQFDTCSITTVTRDEGSFRIESLNDTHHLDSIDDRRLPDF
jgi:probable phosphoglycerate mutase